MQLARVQNVQRINLPFLHVARTYPSNNEFYYIEYIRVKIFGF